MLRDEELPGWAIRVLNAIGEGPKRLAIHDMCMYGATTFVVQHQLISHGVQVVFSQATGWVPATSCVRLMPGWARTAGQHKAFSRQVAHA